MTREQARQYRHEAERKRKAGEFVTAGEYYSQAAFELVGVGAFINTSSGAELRRLLEACTCYRIGGAGQWCTNRARLGELLAEEWAERAFSGEEPSHAFDRAERGVWYEYIGDFRTVGQFGDIDAAYEQAKKVYRDAGDPNANLYEQRHGSNMAFFKSVATASDKNMDEVYSVLKRESFSTWVEYKQEQLPKLLETVIQNESYPP